MTLSISNQENDTPLTKLNKMTLSIEAQRNET
jgi:hypothetical protein